MKTGKNYQSVLSANVATRRAAARRPSFTMDLAGRSVFTHCSEDSTQWVAALGMHRVELRRDAEVFVVEDVMVPGHRILWVVGVVGGTAPTPATACG